MRTPRNARKVLFAMLLQAIVAVAAEPAARSVATHEVLELLAKTDQTRQ